MKKQSNDEEDLSCTLPVLDDPSFCSRMSPMTSEELEILADLRGIKEEARVIRVHLANMHSDWRLWIQHPGKPEIPGTAKPYLKRLAELKTQWRDQAQAYEKARRRRMIALGHEPP